MLLLFIFIFYSECMKKNTDTEIKFNIAIQMALEHSLAQRYKPALNGQHKELMIKNLYL